MVAEYPQLGRDGLIDLPWAPPKVDAKASGTIRYPIDDFYLTNAICRSSPTMQRCSARAGPGRMTRSFTEAGCGMTALPVPGA